MASIASMGSAPASKRVVRYFVSYAHADDKLPERLLGELQKQLGASRQYTFERWQDTRILVGERWRDEIQGALAECDFGLLLVSPSFLGSRFITQYELPAFVEGTKLCIPVALAPIDFDNQDLKGLEQTQIFTFRPPNAKTAKTFGDCTQANHKRDFAHTLFNQIVERLDKVYTPLAGGRPARAASSLAGYRNFIRRHYRHLQLEALGGDHLYRDIELQSVFVPQDARDCLAWLPQALEVPGPLTLAASETLALAELHEHKRFTQTPRRSIFEILNSPSDRHHVVLGAPGAGKSSLMRIRLLAWAEGEDGVKPPILIELRRFHRSVHDDILDYLGQDQDLVYRFDREQLEEQLENGDAELLFDGLDEVFEPGARETIARQIARVTDRYKDIRVIVTSRLIGYPGRILRDAGFGHWLLADLDERGVALFIDRWLNGAIREPGDRPIVRKRLEDALHSPVIREMAGNPLLLTLMAVLARKSDLPRDIASLYARAADLLLEQWDTHRMLSTDVQLGSVIIDQKDKRDLLREIAWKMQTGQRGLRGNLIAKTDVESAMFAAFEHRIQDPGLRRKAIELLIEQLTERNYILCHVGGEQFAFVHRGFLEYFASDHLAQIVTSRPATAIQELFDIYTAHAHDDAWREVLVLAGNRFDPVVADAILAPLVDTVDVATMGKALDNNSSHAFLIVCDVLARAREPERLQRCHASIRRVLEPLLENAKDEPIYPGGRSLGKESVIRLMARTLPDGRTQSQLIRLTEHTEPTVARWKAVEALLEMFPDEKTRDALLPLARSPQVSSAVWTAIDGLTQLFPESRPDITLLAQAREDTSGRAAAIRALAKHYPDEETYTLLVAIAERPEDSDARDAAVAALGEHFSQRDIRPLLTRLANVGPPANAVEGIAVTTLVRTFPDPATRALLHEWVDDERDTPGSRQAVLSLAEAFPDEETRERLLKVAARNDESTKRAAAIAALARHFHDAMVRSLLVGIAIDPGQGRPRFQAMRSLARRFDDNATRELLRTLTSEPTPMGRVAVDILREFFREDLREADLAEAPPYSFKDDFDKG